MRAHRTDAVNIAGKTGDDVLEMFAAIAPRYDRANSILSFGCDARWRRRAAAEARDLPPGPLVDVCSGTGSLAFDLARETGGARPVLALDFCRPMLRIGADRAASRPAPVAFVCADALRLPLADGAAALVSIAFGLRNVADADGCLREMARVAKPGGKVVVLEFSRPRGRFIAPLYAFYSSVVLPRVGRIVSGVPGDAYDYLPRSVAVFPGPEELAGRMRAAGLASVAWRTLTRGIVCLHVGRKA